MNLDNFTIWPIAAVDWFEMYRVKVIAEVTKSHRQAGYERIHDAFIVALLQIFERDSYDASRGSIPQFLAMKTRSVLKDELRSEASRRQREQKKGLRLVADQDSSARDSVDVLADQELADLYRQEIARTDEERAFLSLMELGVTDAGQLAAAIQAQQLSPAERDARIKVYRDRLNARIRRINGDRPKEGTGP